MAYQQSYDPYFLYHPQPQPQPHPHPHPLQPQQPRASGESGAINTLFVSGFPDDVKAREIHNLFRRRPGFESCQLKYTGRGNQVVAFATFVNHHSAITAMHALNGVKFDPQTGSVLHIELARSNSRRKTRPGCGPYVVIDNRTKTSSNAWEETSDDGDSESDEGREAGNGDPVHEVDNSERVDHDEVATAANEQSEKTLFASAGGRPCSTLFIANLGPNCTEDELEPFLSQYPGFNTIKIRVKGGMPVAFADFEEIEQATKVMEDLQGSLLPSSDRGGVHIEYARSKTRKQ